MSKVLVIDDEPRWVEFCESLGYATSTHVPNNVGKYATIILSSRLKFLLSELKDRNCEIMIATGQPSTKEAIVFYNLGVHNYFAKSFSEDTIRKCVE